MSGEPQRIVSLVPSLTEALFALGLGDRVVAVTDWCVHPAEEVALLPKVGGTKNPDVAAIAALAPDLVIANREENTKRCVEQLRDAGLDVRVTYPRGVRDALATLAELADLGADEAARARVLDPIRSALEEAEAELGSRPALPVFCPIWRDPWMSVGGDTYANDVLRLCGGANVFAERGDRRYPIVERGDVEAAGPAVVILPDEPYAFGAKDVQEIRDWDTPASRSGRIHVIDGTWASWYGPRIAAAMRGIRSLLSAPPEPVA